MDNRISVGDKIELELLDTRLSANPNKKSEKYVSQVLDEAPNNRIYASMPIRGGNVVPLGVGQTFDATFFAKNGLMSCKLTVTGRYKKANLFLMELEQVTELEKVQRRMYFRLECRKPIKYRLIEGEEEEMIRSGNAYVPDEQNITWKDAVMIDISGGGMFMVSAFRENKETLLEVQFEVEYNNQIEILYVYANLLRSEHNENNNMLFNHRIMFWKLDNGTREKIIQYIFTEQRKRFAHQ